MNLIQYALLISLLSVAYLLPNGEPRRTLKPLPPEQAFAYTEVGNSDQHESFEAMQKESSPRPAAKLSRIAVPGLVRGHTRATEQIPGEISEIQQALRLNPSEAVVNQLAYLASPFGPPTAVKR